MRSGTQSFGRFMFLLIPACIIASIFVPGAWLVIVLAGIPILIFCNALNRRDIADERKSAPTKTKSSSTKMKETRKKNPQWHEPGGSWWNS